MSSAPDFRRAQTAPAPSLQDSRRIFPLPKSTPTQVQGSFIETLVEKLAPAIITRLAQSTEVQVQPAGQAQPHQPSFSSLSPAAASHHANRNQGKQILERNPPLSNQSVNRGYSNPTHQRPNFAGNRRRISFRVGKSRRYNAIRSAGHPVSRALVNRSVRPFHQLQQQRHSDTQVRNQEPAPRPTAPSLANTAIPNRGNIDLISKEHINTVATPAEICFQAASGTDAYLGQSNPMKTASPFQESRITRGLSPELKRSGLLRNSWNEDSSSADRIRRFSSIVSNHEADVASPPEKFDELLPDWTDDDENTNLKSPTTPQTPGGLFQSDISPHIHKSGSVYDGNNFAANPSFQPWHKNRLRSRPQPTAILQDFKNFQDHEDNRFSDGFVMQSVENEDEEAGIWDVPATPPYSSSGSGSSASPLLYNDRCKEEEEAEEYDVAKIVGEKIGPDKHEFLLEWVGYQGRYWIHAEHCFCPDKVWKFRQRQRAELRAAQRAGDTMTVDILQQLTDNGIGRNIDNLKLPKAKGWKLSRRNAFNGRFQRPGIGNGVVTIVRLPTEPLLPGNLRANTAILPVNHPRANIEEAPGEGEVIWIRSDVVQHRNTIPRRSPRVKGESQMAISPWSGDEFNNRIRNYKLERRESRRRAAADAEQLRLDAQRRAENEAREKRLREWNEKRARHSQQMLHVLEVQSATYAKTSKLHAEPASKPRSGLGVQEQKGKSALRFRNPALTFPRHRLPTVTPAKYSLPKVERRPGRPERAVSSMRRSMNRHDLEHAFAKEARRKDAEKPNLVRSEFRESLGIKKAENLINRAKR
jgi:hypothetical protein